jgi:hypothetical protein
MSNTLKWILGVEEGNRNGDQRRGRTGERGRIGEEEKEEKQKD